MQRLGAASTSQCSSFTLERTGKTSLGYVWLDTSERAFAVRPINRLRLNNTSNHLPLFLSILLFDFPTTSTTHPSFKLLGRSSGFEPPCYLWSRLVGLEAGSELISIFFRCSWLSRTHHTVRQTVQTVNSVSTSALPNSSIQLRPLPLLPSPHHIARDKSGTFSVPARIQVFYPPFSHA